MTPPDWASQKVEELIELERYREKFARRECMDANRAMHAYAQIILNDLLSALQRGRTATRKGSR